MTSTLSESDAIVRRRVFEKDQEIKSLTNNINHYLKLSNQPTNNTNISKDAQSIQQQREAIFDEIQREIAAVELTATKYHNITKTIKHEVDSYAQTRQSINQSIDRTKAELIQLRSKLAEEQIVRNHRQECDFIAQQILKKQSTSELQAQMESVNESINRLQASKQTIENQKDIQTKQFATVLTLVNQMNIDWKRAGAEIAALKPVPIKQKKKSKSKSTVGTAAVPIQIDSQMTDV